jgi:hypothetical protein
MGVHDKKIYPGVSMVLIYHPYQDTDEALLYLVLHFSSERIYGCLAAIRALHLQYATAIDLVPPEPYPRKTWPARSCCHNGPVSAD